MTDILAGVASVSILETLVDAVLIVDEDHRIVWANGSCERLFGWRRDELVGRDMGVIAPLSATEQLDGFLAAFRPEMGGGRVLGVGRPLEAERKDGSRLPVEVGLAMFEEDGRRYVTGFIRDMSERLAAEEKLRHLATHDPLTGLANADPLVEAADRALTAGTTVSVVAVILAGLYHIGERHGRAAARHVLRTVSRRMGTMMTGDGPVARVDGAFFAVLTTDPAAETVAARLWTDVTSPIPWGAEDLRLVASVGVARADESFSSGEALMVAAYGAANDGLAHNRRGGVSVFTSELGRRLEHEAQVEERLRAAVAAGGLSLMMQAKVRATDGRILGAEALVRWTDDLLGPVPPSEFIPLAERTGIIPDLTAWVMHRSLAEAADWQRSGLDLRVAVNLSAVDLRQPHLIADVRAAIAASGCEPARVIVELTESAVAEDPDEAVTRLRALKDLGVSLSLDDFGTGYSSLSYLRRFPIDTLKIDRSFVTDTPHDPDAVAIARTIVALAHSLGMSTVAEGVENRAQAGFLRDLGVDVLQGYLYSRPVPPNQFRTLAMADAIDVRP